MTRGGPVNATHLMATLSYQRGILGRPLGEGAAIATAMVPFLLAAILVCGSACSAASGSREETMTDGLIDSRVTRPSRRRYARA